MNFKETEMTDRIRTMEGARPGMPVSRPTGGATVVPDRYRPDAIEYALDQVMSGQALRVTCRDADMPSLQTIKKWLRNDEDFKKRYIDAMRVRTLLEADNLIAIADGVLAPETAERDAQSVSEGVARDRLRIETRLKLLAKLEPTIFGDKVAVDHDVGGELAEMFRAAANRGHALPEDKVVPPSGGHVLPGD